jgi:hypothetical protein
VASEGCRFPQQHAQNDRYVDEQELSNWEGWGCGFEKRKMALVGHLEQLR